MNHQRRIIGCMTGTSLDGLDCSLVEVTGSGLEMNIQSLRHHSASLEDIREPLKALAMGEACSARDWVQTCNRFSEIHAEAIEPLLATENVDLIAVHGQTVYHDPPHSIQLFNPSILAHRLKLPVVCDLRAADLACGGQGAPMTPLADRVMYANEEEQNKVVLNLGGFSNYTYLPASQEIEEILGGDICVCNQFLDTIIQRGEGKAYDHDGALAQQGRVLDQLKDVWLERFLQQAREGRSLGSGDESFSLIDPALENSSCADVLKTACEVIAETIAEQLPSSEVLIVAGGGAKNRVLTEALQRACQAELKTSECYGIPVDYRESVAMAVLGALSEDRVPITLSQVTGVESAPNAGLWVRP